MSTYNGNQYIREQISSIFAQVDIKVKLLIRDDGSKDNTIEIIRSIYNEDIELVVESNIGVANSYYQLLKMAAGRDEKYDYFALADQDDIWLPDKLISAIQLIKEKKADLYCGSLDAFKDKSPVSRHMFINKNLFSDTELMLRSSVPGCTMVFNSKLLFRICEYTPQWMEMHDSWILRVCKYTGMKVVMDSVPKIRYRLHDNNTCGAAITLKAKILFHVKNVFLKKQMASVTAHEILQGYEQYLDISVKNYLKVLDKTTAVNYRKFRLVMYCLGSEFSTFSRRMDFLFGILTNRI